MEWLEVINGRHGAETTKDPTKRNMPRVVSEQKLKDGSLFLKVAHIKDYTNLMTSVTTVAEKHGMNIGSVQSKPGIGGVINIMIIPTETKSIGTGTNTISGSKVR